MNKQRLEAFTDAILAIIMTIMVLELHTPKNASLGGLLDEGIPYLAFVISFIGLANLWATHHFIFQRMKNVSYGLYVANMGLLLWVSLVPVATAWVAENPTKFLPQFCYVLILFGWSELIIFIGYLAQKNNPDYKRRTLKNQWGQEAFLLCGAALTPFVPYVALSTGVAIILWYLLRPASNFEY